MINLAGSRLSISQAALSLNQAACNAALVPVVKELFESFSRPQPGETPTDFSYRSGGQLGMDWGLSVAVSALVRHGSLQARWLTLMFPEGFIQGASRQTHRAVKDRFDHDVAQCLLTLTDPMLGMDGEASSIANDKGRTPSSHA